MSTPRNHHYVSQIHLKNFYNSLDKKIYVYDKQLKNHYSKSSTKTLFSEIDSNTRFINGKKDFHHLENDLNTNFEKDFLSNQLIIENFLQTGEFNKDTNNALLYFAKYAVIGNLRTPQHKKSVDDMIYGSIGKLIPMCTPKLKKELKQMFAYKEEVKYSNSINYSDIADGFLNLMGNLIFKIIVPINNDDYFIVPDCSSYVIRDKINTYFNPDIKEIAQIGFPLSSKIYIHYFSEKLFKGKAVTSSIILEDTSTINEINKNNLSVCHSKIACENEGYLRKFINDLDINSRLPKDV